MLVAKGETFCEENEILKRSLDLSTMVSLESFAVTCSQLSGCPLAQSDFDLVRATRKITSLNCSLGATCF